MLVIDDDPGLCETLSVGLRELAGHAVSTAPSVAAGLALADQHAYDALLVDLVLPDGTGLDVLARVTQPKSVMATKYVLTGFGSIETAVQAIKLGAADYLKKPLDIDDLVDVLSPGKRDSVSRAPALDRRLSTVLTMIERDPSVTIEALCAAVELSQSRLRHLFRTGLGQSLSQHARVVKLDKAAELLRTTHQRISDIAFAIGFVDPGYFERCFRHRFGSSPSRYRVDSWKGA